MGEGLILWVQQCVNGFWDGFFGFVTNLGSESFYLVFIPFLYWCVSKRSGFRLALVFSVSGILNAGLKELFHLPRPDATRVRVLLAETGPGYGFPSGHTQGVSSFWFTLAKEYPKRWLITVSCIIVFLVGLSRIYLGVHWPTDVLGGLIFGIIFVFGGLALLDKFEKLFLTQSLAVQFIIALGMPLFLLLVNRGDTSLSLIGNMIGFSMGAIVDREWIGFVERDKWQWQLVKLALGLGTLFALKVSLKVILPVGDVFRVVRYGVIGFTATAILPYIFTKIKFTTTERANFQS